MTAQMKKFESKTATLEEFNRELKRLATQKCLTGKKLSAAIEAEDTEAMQELQKKYDQVVATYKKVAAQKARKFPGRKTYMDMTVAEIAELDLKTTVAGIASLACKRSRYPEQAEEVKKQEARFQAHKAELTEKAELARLTKKYSSNS